MIVRCRCERARLSQRRVVPLPREANVFFRTSIRQGRATSRGRGQQHIGILDLLVFSETAGAELLRLTENERLAVQGSLKIELYQPEGKPARISRTIFVDSVLALRAAPKQKKAKPPAAPVSTRVSSSLDRVNILPDAGSDLDDDIPF